MKQLLRHPNDYKNFLLFFFSPSIRMGGKSVNFEERKKKQETSFKETLKVTKQCLLRLMIINC